MQTSRTRCFVFEPLPNVKKDLSYKYIAIVSSGTTRSVHIPDLERVIAGDTPHPKPLTR